MLRKPQDANQTRTWSFSFDYKTSNKIRRVFDIKIDAVLLRIVHNEFEPDES